MISIVFFTENYKQIKSFKVITVNVHYMITSAVFTDMENLKKMEKRTALLQRDLNRAEQLRWFS